MARGNGEEGSIGGSGTKGVRKGMVEEGGSVKWTAVLGVGAWWE